MPTGPGGLDSNGIWQFGEDDTEALASDLLNLGMGSVSDAFTNLAGVLQVVSTTMKAVFSTTSSTYVDITGLTATITPRATSSKIIVTVSVSYGHSATNSSHLTIRDGSNNVLIDPTSPGIRAQGFMSVTVDQTAQMPASFTFLHEPSTTSAFTYKVSGTTAGGTFFINRSDQDANSSNRGRGISTIILMEVAG